MFVKELDILPVIAETEIDTEDNILTVEIVLVIDIVSVNEIAILTNENMVDNIADKDILQETETMKDLIIAENNIDKGIVNIVIGIMVENDTVRKKNIIPEKRINIDILGTMMTIVRENVIMVTKEVCLLKI